MNNESIDEIPSKSLKQLVEEGTISKAQLKSLLLLAQTGMFFSSTPEDAEYIAVQIGKLNSGEEIGHIQGADQTPKHGGNRS